MKRFEVVNNDIVDRNKYRSKVLSATYIIHRIDDFLDCNKTSSNGAEEDINEE